MELASSHVTPLVLRFQATPDQVGPARRAIAAYASKHGVIDVHGVALAVSEAVSNAVVHAYADAAEPGEVQIVAERLADDGLEIRVCDQGRGMKARPDSPGIGVGLPLIATLAEHLEVMARPGGGTRLCMGFAVAESAR
jgi:serine/threonine-protein kinase RsbW/stage II sporulation protein AB (anti-sigma F factor)